MPSTVRIKLKNGWNYSFDTDDYEMIDHDTRKCPYCENTYFDTVYCYIVDSLKEAGLLHEDFEEICCCCLVLRRFGLMDLRDKLINFSYKKEDDYLLVEFSFKTELSEIMSGFITIKIGIHDWSKVELFKS